MIITDELKAFYLNSSSDTVLLELFEISHSNFSHVYYLSPHILDTLTVTHEDETVHDYNYAPMSTEVQETRENLDWGVTVTFGDLGEYIPGEIDRIRAADNFREKPQVIYRVYRSDVLTYPMFGPVRLEVTTLPTTWEGTAFQAEARRLNINKTGLVYTVSTVPMLRGFL